MRIGVIILPEDPWSRAMGMWKSLEERGFAHAWIYDHLAWRSLADGPWYATMPTLAAAALVTERIQLGTWVTSPNFRHPVTLAKDLLTLDDMSGGRCSPAWAPAASAGTRRCSAVPTCHPGSGSTASPSSSS